MTSLSLLSGEKLLIEGGGDKSKIWLTDHRIVQQYTTGFFSRRTETTTIALENIESIESFYRRDPFLAVLGIAFIVAAIFAATTNGVTGTVTAAIGVLFLVLFATRRRAGGKIHGTRSTIEFFAQGKAQHEIEDFLRDVQDAKARLTASR